MEKFVLDTRAFEADKQMTLSQFLEKRGFVDKNAFIRRRNDLVMEVLDTSSSFFDWVMSSGPWGRIQVLPAWAVFRGSLDKAGMIAPSRFDVKIAPGKKKQFDRLLTAVNELRPLLTTAEKKQLGDLFDESLARSAAGIRPATEAEWLVAFRQHVKKLSQALVAAGDRKLAETVFTDLKKALTKGTGFRLGNIGKVKAVNQAWLSVMALCKEMETSDAVLDIQDLLQIVTVNERAVTSGLEKKQAAKEAAVQKKPVEKKVKKRTGKSGTHMLASNRPAVKTVKIKGQSSLQKSFVAVDQMAAWMAPVMSAVTKPEDLMPVIQALEIIKQPACNPNIQLEDREKIYDDFDSATRSLKPNEKRRAIHQCQVLVKTRLKELEEEEPELYQAFVQLLTDALNRAVSDYASKGRELLSMAPDMTGLAAAQMEMIAAKLAQGRTFLVPRNEPADAAAKIKLEMILALNAVSLACKTAKRHACAGKVRQAAAQMTAGL